MNFQISGNTYTYLRFLDFNYPAKKVFDEENAMFRAMTA